jgi:cytochrome c553
VNAGLRFRPLLASGAILLTAVPLALFGGAAAPPASKPNATTATCQACHGAHGEGVPAAHVPRIAGQTAEYLKKQLDDYADGTRANPIMVNFAKPLSDKQRRDLAALFAAMSAPFVAQAGAVNPVALARGHQLAYQCDENRRVQACNNCHGPDGVGVPYSAPYLAGQSAEYLAGAIKAWHDGTRKNDAGQLMSSVAERLNDADTTAVAAYFASVESRRTGY